MKAEVSQAVAEIKDTFPGHSVETFDDGEGGANVIVDGLELGALYAQPETWAGFHITFQYPYADVYPHFVRGDLSRVDGRVLGEGTSPSTFLDRPAIQLSRRSNRLDPTRDTAALKLLKVMEWLRSHP